VWLREGVRFWLRTSLTGELLRWSSVVERARDMARHLGPFLAARGITDPLLTDDRAALRPETAIATANRKLGEPQAR
jgi:hypothetical protein